MPALMMEYARKTILAFQANEQKRSGGNETEARANVAKNSRISFWTLQNIVWRRVNKVKPPILQRLRAYAIKDMEAECAGLLQLLDTARKMGLEADPEKVRQVEECLSGAQRLLAELRGERP